MSRKKNVLSTETLLLAQNLILLTQMRLLRSSNITGKKSCQMSEDVFSLLHHINALTEAFLSIFNPSSQIESSFPLVRTLIATFQTLLYSNSSVISP